VTGEPRRGLEIGAVLSPIADWATVAAAATAADDAGLDAIGMYDHYHSARPDWAYICGWSAYGALAGLTTRVRLVPMVLNGLHYELGVLAKESAVLSLLSGGRFELAIGAGDWPGSFEAWGQPFPDAESRLERLDETVAAVRRLWSGEAIDFDGRHIQLRGAISTPAPERPPPVVVGVGGSRRTLARAVTFADEVNLYDDRALIAAAGDAIQASGRPLRRSVFLSWEWEKWPADPEAALVDLASRGIDRAFVTLAAPDILDRISTLGRIRRTIGR
jgi:alkanesulfonate monooxygenase SsuD/methylene tetrahydromethanopterin reductase-like flavin-dependent oxidoreductase (luciferase family)